MASCLRLCAHLAPVTFPTYHSVVLRDWRLGCLTFLLDLCIVAYGIFLLNDRLLYMEDMRAEHEVSLRLFPPSNGLGQYQWTEKESMKYCCENPACQPVESMTSQEIDLESQDAFHGPKWEDISKRCKCPGTNAISFGCIRRGAESIMMHHGSGIDIVLSESRYLSTWQKNYNGAEGWFVDRQESVVMHNIEQFKLQIKHYVSTPEFSTHIKRHYRKTPTLSDREMEGFWRIADDTQSQRDICKSRPDARTGLRYSKLTDTAPCYINATDIGTIEPNTFRIQFLLDMMGVDLDDIAGPNLGTIRYEGFTVYFYVNHYNALPWVGSLGKTIYVYSLQAVMNPLRNQDSHRLLGMPTPDLQAHNRLAFKPKYMHMVCRHVPALKKVSIACGLLVIARLAVLFTVVRFVVRCFAENCMPRLSEAYHELLTTVSPNYRDIQQLLSLDDFALKRSLSALKLSTHFDKRRAKKQLLQDGFESGMHLREDVHQDLEMAVMA